MNDRIQWRNQAFHLLLKVENFKTHLDNLLHCIELEEQEQMNRFRLEGENSLKNLKAEGLAIHPISITRKSFGYADYPEISFRIPFPGEYSGFRDGLPIECFCHGEESIKGLLLFCDGKQGEFRLFAPDFPDWIEDSGVGIKLAPDSRTTQTMKKALEQINESAALSRLFQLIHSDIDDLPTRKQTSSEPAIKFTNNSLNESQKNTVAGISSNEDVLIVHGPPGTGKTTTLIEAILQLVKKGERILVSTPSNTAVDHIASGLIGTSVNFIRVGNNSKVNEQIFPYTPEGKLKDSKQEKEIKKLKIRAEEMRKMALQYKRRFGKDEREQRNLLFREVKSIRNQIKDYQRYNEDELFDKAHVVLGTPIGLVDSRLEKVEFDTLIIDEAGQCLEPLAWCIFPMAKKIVLAGDHLQLPPTVLSDKAMRLGFNRSILEVCFRRFPETFLLDTQYRMRQSIAAFSNDYFYEGKLKTTDELKDLQDHFIFYDTAGAGCEEEQGKVGNSLMNQGEMDVVVQLIELNGLDPTKTAVISPYSGQINLAGECLPKSIRISTIDSFQGQEMENVIISLVRSNDEGEIGFLKDHRRMNVAMTRAKERLFVIGDSSTLAQDPYFSKLIDHAEKTNAYRSVWEIR